MKTADNLFNDIEENLSSDRQRLEDYCEKLMQKLETVDQEIFISAADGIAKLTAELTRNNNQLIEIAKLKSKRELSQIDQEISGDEKDLFYDDIGEGFGDAN